MKIYKAGIHGADIEGSEEQMEEINRFAKAQLTAEQVYTFSVVLCDNEVDRDFERFSEKALEELRELFVGRTGIFDHEWKAENQTARLYRTELVRSPELKTQTGEDYCCLKGWAYMLRNEKNAALIEEIDAGIKKETSIGCSVKRRVCSICGAEHGSGCCGHIQGREYDGKLCYVVLDGCEDAYEWSFVAVPAQRQSGVTKKLGGDGSLKSFVGSAEGAHLAKEYEALEKDAVLGREYKNELRTEVLRLGLLCDEKLYEALEGSVGLMDAGQLAALKGAFEKRLEGVFPARTQLPGRNEVAEFDGGDYMV